MKQFVWLAVILVLISGCANDPEKVYKPAPLTPAYPIEISWAKKLTEIGKDKYVRLLPASDGTYLYVADKLGNLNKIDSQTGKIVWQKFIGSVFSSGPSIADGVLYIGTKNAEIYALSAESGDLIWFQAVTSEVLSPPAISANTIVAQTNDGALFGLSRSNGKVVWVANQNVPNLTLRGNSSPVIVGDKVYAGFANGKLTALSITDGKQLWETVVSPAKGRTELERLIDIDGPIIHQDGILYMSSYRGRVAALEADTGRIIWTREMSSHLGVVAGKSFVYLTDAAGRVWALNKETGATLWMQDKLNELANSRPAIVDDKLLVGDVTGEVYWLNKSDGRLLGHLPHKEVSYLSGATYYVDELEDEGYYKERRVETAVIFQPLLVENNVLLTYQNGILVSLSSIKSN